MLTDWWAHVKMDEMSQPKLLLNLLLLLPLYPIKSMDFSRSGLAYGRRTSRITAFYALRWNMNGELDLKWNIQRGIYYCLNYKDLDLYANVSAKRMEKLSNQNDICIDFVIEKVIGVWWTLRLIFEFSWQIKHRLMLLAAWLGLFCIVSRFDEKLKLSNKLIFELEWMSFARAFFKHRYLNFNTATSFASFKCERKIVQFNNQHWP